MVFMGTISLIIPVINEENKIEQCLEAVFNQSFQPFEVILVDGHSKDSTVKRAKRYPIVVLFEDYHSRAGACQMGLENAHGEFVAFTDADCLPQKDWLKNLIKEFDEGVVGVGGGIKNIGETFWEKSINFTTRTFLGSANSVQGRLFNDKRHVKSISGCNSIYRKADLVKVGGFNIALSTAEDTELNGKMLKIGKLLYTPDAIILHNHQRSLKQFGKRMYQYGYGRAKIRLWDLQAIPPILILFLPAIIKFDPILFFIIMVIYIFSLLVMGMKFVFEEKNIKYFISVPIVYILEHSLYTIGFWRGIISSLGDI